MVDLADIAELAFDGVESGIDGVSLVATVTVSTRGAYTVATGIYATTDVVTTGRVIFVSETPIKDIFPDFNAGPTDELAVLEGFTDVSEGAVLTVGSDVYSISQVLDIARVGTVFYVVGRKQ